MKLPLRLIQFIGLLVPRSLRTDWRQEWKAELHWREQQLAAWDKLTLKNKLDLWWHSAGAFADALWLQPKRWEDEMMQDIRFGARMLAQHKTFTLIAVITLALGIGANTAIFSVINVVLLRGLPYPTADRLVLIWQTHPDMPRVGPALLDYYDWQAQSQSFEAIAIHVDRLRHAALTGVSEPVKVQGSMVSQNFFSTLGLKPMLGRTFLPEEEQPDKNQVVLISRALWQRTFASDPNIVGKSIRLNDAAYTVVGVLGEQYPLAMDVWLPLSRLGGDTFTNRKSHVAAAAIGRLKPGVTLEQAQREMTGIAVRAQQLYPDSNKSIGVTLVPLRD
jgi:hypothetical protein